MQRQEIFSHTIITRYLSLPFSPSMMAVSAPSGMVKVPPFGIPTPRFLKPTAAMRSTIPSTFGSVIPNPCMYCLMSVAV